MIMVCIPPDNNLPSKSSFLTSVLEWAHVFICFYETIKGFLVARRLLKNVTCAKYVSVMITSDQYFLCRPSCEQVSS